MTELTEREKEVLATINGVDGEASRKVFFIPERKSPDMTDDIWELRGVLKSLVYKGLIKFDVDFKGKCLVFYTMQPGSLGDAVYPSVLDAEVIV